MESPQQPGGPAGPETPPGSAGAPPPAGYPPPPPPQYTAPPQPPGTFAGAELASWGSRVGAMLLDSLVVLGVGLALCAPGGIVAIATEGHVAGWVLLGLGVLAWIAFSVLYAPYFMRRPGEHNGQTLGKQWLGLRVIRTDGQPMGFGWAALREVLVKNFGVGVASAFTLGLAALANYLWPLFDDQNRALHDYVASTRVVRV